MTDKKPEARPASLDSLADCAVTWRHIAPSGVTLDDCRHPAYWRNVIRECSQQRIGGRHAYNRIEILAEDGTWEAELRVMSAGDGLVHTRLLREWKAEVKVGRKPTAPEGYVVEHITGNGWRALDPAGEFVAQRLTTEDEAVRAAAAHARKVKGD